MSEMTPERHARIKEVFTAACALPKEQRAATVDQLCAGDADLAAGVHRLLDNFNPSEPTMAPPALMHAPLALAPMGESPLAPVNRNDSTRHLPSRSSSHGLGKGSSESGSSGVRDVAEPPVEDDDPPDQPAEFAPGQVIAGRYRVVAPLGVGGMGSVYRADDMLLSQQVALKFLSPRFVSDPAAMERFLNEVRIAREISHPNVCRVFDIGNAEGTPFISMEYVDGENLAVLLKRIDRPTGDKSLDIARQICAGLAAAHARGVLHRDLKPANIMLDGDGRVRITDFGLAGIAGQVRPNEIRAGTPRYMAPEQIAGTAVSQRSDIYSLGLVLYEVFTGKPAFDAGNAAEYFKLHRSKEPATPSSIVADMDPVVERVILSCLQKDPKHRPASVLDVATALPGGDALAAALAAGETPSPESVAAAGRHDRMAPSKAAYALVGLAALIGLLFALGRAGELDRWRELSRSPEGLSRPCRRLLEQLGYRQPPHIADGWMDTSELSASDFDMETRTALATMPAAGTWYPAALHKRMAYWFRSSDEPLVPGTAANVVLSQARVLWSDPARLTAAECNIALNPDGQLLYFSMRGGTPEAPPESPDVYWDALFRRAGLEKGSFAPASPMLLSPVPADLRLAWEYRHGESQITHVEAALANGRPCYFHVLLSTPKGRGESIIARRTSFATATLVLILGLLAIGAPLAARNLAGGGADRRGARQLAIGIAVLHMLTWLLHSSHSAHIRDELILLRFALIGAFAEAAMVWMFYIALEPYIRRSWPQCMISWTRLLARRVSDPLVGRHLLLGTVLGAGFAVMTRVDAALPSLWGESPRIQLRDNSSVMPFLEGRHAVAACLDRLRMATYESLAFALILVLLHSRLKRPLYAILGSALVVALLYVPRGAHPVTSWLTVGIGIVLPAFWLLTREGLLLVAVASLVTRLLVIMPAALDLRAWHADVTFLILAVVAGMAAYGYVAATRGGTPASGVTRPELAT